MSSTKDNATVTLAELLYYHDERFIQGAYQAILGRAPDMEGMHYYLARIRSGIGKIEILSQLYNSEEGRARKPKIPGLRKAFVRHNRLRTPIIGSLYRFAGFDQIGESDRRSLRAANNKLDVIEAQSRQRFLNIDIALGDIHREMRALSERLSAEPLNSPNNTASNRGDVATATRVTEIALDNTHGEGQVLGAENNNRSSTVPAGQVDLIRYAGKRVASFQMESYYVSPEDGKEYDLRYERIRHAEYLKLISDSGLFDRVFYTSSYSIDPIFHDEPVLHYVLIGESKGLQPNPDFWPGAYLQINMDVAAAGLDPFKHFLQVGRWEGRRSRPLPPIEGGINTTPLPIVRGRGFPNPKKIAVCLHIYYVDLWKQLRETIARLEEDFDLFVSLVDRGSPLDSVRGEILSAYPNARVFVFPNHGRDIFPFVYMATAGLFDPYDAICKIHTKKSPHREDGDFWRTHLINGIVPECDAGDLLNGFLANEKLGIWVADGQIYEGDKWWGANNKGRVAELLHRIEIRHPLDRLTFPAGSIYWLKRPIINLIRGMQLTEVDFEAEDSQVDGTSAHAFERILGYLAEAANVDLVQTSEVQSRNLKRRGESGAAKLKPFVSCFYLPQFHSIPENDAWWGEGYTEWIGAAKAKPQFGGHYQPVVPVGTGFYDLRDPEVIGRQYKLAKSHGISAFCMYYYSFDHGRRLLEAPLENLLVRKDIDACFYLCWANESWTRNWDGLSGEVLMPQSYLPGCEDEIASDSARFFSDPRYYRLNGVEPRFVIYRPEDIPNVGDFVERLRSAWRKLGFPRVNLGAVLFHLNDDPDEDLVSTFDFFIEMPPHGLVGSGDYIVGGDNPDVSFPVDANFKGLVYSYNKVIENSIAREFPANLGGKVIRGVMPSWDNTARRGNRAHISFGANPARFGSWVDGLLEKGLASGELMINAWNEWGEKAVMEPNCQYGKGYLEALKYSLHKVSNK
ncbi:glycoside hydrolase family 99-like domain-containing protein [Cupriavidus sp. CuC1]|uniref:glycoside hydrolase family 99-like domain-containing protein n=1 Tax=Cupriavidus sp. CuC1 TaxID=3373131 RepID=UPI0037D57BD3